MTVSRQAQTGETQTEIWSLLRLGNVMRRFIPNFSDVLEMLNTNLFQTQPKSFPSLTVAEKWAVERLKDLLKNPPVFAVLRATGLYTVDTSVCNKQIDFVLLQEQPHGPARSILNLSRTLKDKQTEMTSTPLESLAVVLAVFLLRCCLVGNQLTVQTDYKVWRQLWTISDASVKLSRWSLRLSDFEFDIVPHGGIKYKRSDSMWRLTREELTRPSGFAISRRLQNQRTYPIPTKPINNEKPWRSTNSRPYKNSTGISLNCTHCTAGKSWKIETYNPDVG